MLQGHAGVSCSIVIDVTRKERNVYRLYIHIIDYEQLVKEPGLKGTVMKSHGNRDKHGNHYTEGK